MLSVSFYFPILLVIRKHVLLLRLFSFLFFFFFEIFFYFFISSLKVPALLKKFIGAVSGITCSMPIISGFREKIFENIGVKVNAAGFYVNPSVFSTAQLWKGRSATEILEDSSIFSSIFEGSNNS